MKEGLYVNVEDVMDTLVELFADRKFSMDTMESEMRKKAVIYVGEDGGIVRKK